MSQLSQNVRHWFRRWRWRDTLADLFAVDGRTLGLARIAIGLVLLMNLVTRAADLAAMYSDAGILPRSVVRDFYEASGVWRWSLHMLGGSTEFQALLFAAAGLLALALLVGYRTRLATIGSWLLLASLHVRMPLLVTGGDVLLCMLLFWGMFLPLGDHWSLDVRRRRQRAASEPATWKPADQVLSPASAAILLQVGLMYLMTGWGKCNSYWYTGEAVRNALSYDMIARPLGQHLLQYPDLLKLITWSTLALELVGPLLLFCPLGTRYVRPLTVLAFVALHVGIELTMRVTVFSFASLAALVLFVPREFWQLEWVRRRLPGQVAAEPDVPDAPVKVVPPEKSAWAGWRSRLVWLRDAVVLLMLAYVVVYNIGGHLGGDAFLRATPAALDRVTDLAMLGQSWTMFVEPHALDSRFAAAARLRNGQVVDVLRDGAEVDFGEARQWPARMKSQRWMLAFRELADDRNNWFRQSAAEYFYRQWNSGRPAERQIEMLDLLQVQVKPWVSGPAGPAMVRLGRVDALERGPHRNGLRHGAWVLRHEDGSLASEGTYRHGLRQGRWVFYHPNGRRSAEGPYVDDKQHGLWTHWLSDGQLEGEGTYQNGQMHGRWVFWYEDGRRLQVLYEHDRPVEQGALGQGPAPTPSQTEIPVQTRSQGQSQHQAQPREDNAMTITVRSTAFAAGQPIPRKHTGDGDDLSPPLTWSGVPDNAQELVLICDDPDAPTPQPWVHWVLYGLSPHQTELPEGVPPSGSLSGPLTARQGKNSWPSGQTVGYRGPAPPMGHGTHHYHFKLYALDSRLDLPPGADKASLLAAMKGHILAQGELVGTYER